MRTGLMTWVGGEHEFALDIGALRALQAACDAGPEQILRRLTAGGWRVDDLYETHRLGLMGGGMAEREARDLVVRLFGQHPLMPFRLSATRILAAALVGPEDDPLGERTGAAPPPENGGSA